MKDQNNTAPFFSIITLTLNSEKYIKECVQSLDNQGFENYEHIIVDGSSTDNTLKIIHQEKNPRRKIINCTKKGLYASLNYGISKANGQYIGVLHSDDVYCSGDVLKYSYNEIIGSHPDIYSGAVFFISDKNSSAIKRVWTPSDFSKIKLFNGWMPPHTTSFISRKVYEDGYGYDEGLSCAADYKFFVNFFTNNSNAKFLFSKRPITKMRLGGVSTGNINSILKKSFEDYKVIREFKLMGLWTLIAKNIRKMRQLFLET